MIKLNKLIFVIVLLIVSLVSFAEINTFDDWIIIKSCEKAEDRTTQLCQGYYLEPKYFYPINAGVNYPISITADKSEFLSKKTSKFFGDVVIQQGNDTLKADKADVIHNDAKGSVETITAAGKVKFTQPELRVDGSKIVVYKQKDQKIIYDPIYRLYKKHARGIATSVTINKNTQMYLPKASYTTCAPTNNAWHLEAQKVKLDKDTGRGEAWHCWLHIKGKKVFYLPYLNFPIDDRRQTGFLMPSVHSSSTDGLHIMAPYYWNIAPNYDAIITPQFMVERGIKIDNHFRFLSKNSQGNIKFNILPNDVGYKRFREEKLKNLNGINTKTQKYLNLRKLSKRWAFSFDNKTSFNQNFKLNIDYTKIGDDNYIHDFEGDITYNSYPIYEVGVVSPKTDGENLTTSKVRQKLELQHLSALGVANYRLDQYQVLHPFDGANTTEIYRKLPEIDFKSNILHDPCGFFSWKLDANYTQFKIRKRQYETEKSTGNRYHLRPAIEHRFGNAGYFIKPRVEWFITGYNSMKLNNADKKKKIAIDATNSVPIYTLDSGMNFVRDIFVGKKQFEQTLEPRIYYVSIPKRSQQHLPLFDTALFPIDYSHVFRSNRYSGFDRVGEADQLGFGVKSSFFTKPGNVEKASIAIGRILYFRTRHSNLPGEKTDHKRWSPIMAIAKYNINSQWNITANLVQRNRKITDSGSYTIQYLIDPRHVVNFDYQFMRKENIDIKTRKPLHLRNFKLSSVWEFMPKMRLLGGVKYDLNLNRVDNVLLGLENHGCCTIWRLAWSRMKKSDSTIENKKYKHAISFQFVLKGLSQTGRYDKTKINDMIPGYSPEDHEF